MSADRAPVVVRFNEGEFETGVLAGMARARRVAERGLHRTHGRFAGGMAELVDHATGEVIETVSVID